MRRLCLMFGVYALLTSQAHAGNFDIKIDNASGTLNAASNIVRGWFGGTSKATSEPIKMASASTFVRPGSDYSVSIWMIPGIDKVFVEPAKNSIKRKTGVDITVVERSGFGQVPTALNIKRNNIPVADAALCYGDLESVENFSGMAPSEWKAQNFVSQVFAANPLIIIADRKFPFTSLSSEQLKNILLGNAVVLKTSPKSKMSWEIVPAIQNDEILAYTLRRDLLNDRPFAGNVMRFDDTRDIPNMLQRYYVPPNKKTGIGRISIAVIGSWDACRSKPEMAEAKRVKSDLKIDVPYILVASEPPTPALQKVVDFYNGEGAMFVTPELPRQLKQ